MQGQLRNRFDPGEVTHLAKKYDLPEEFLSESAFAGAQVNVAWGTAKEGYGLLTAINALEKAGELPAGYRIAETGFTSAASEASKQCDSVTVDGVGEPPSF